MPKYNNTSKNNNKNLKFNEMYTIKLKCLYDNLATSFTSDIYTQNHKSHTLIPHFIAFRIPPT